MIAAAVQRKGDGYMACPECGQANAENQESAEACRQHVRDTFGSGLFRCICILMTVTAFLYLCSGRFGLFWILFSIAGWITCGGQTSPKRMATGIQFYNVTLKILRIVMLVLSGVFAVLSVTIWIVGFFSGDTWLSYLAGVCTEYGGGMVPVAALGRILDVVLPLGGMLAVGVAAFVLVVIAAAVFLLAKLVQPVQKYMEGMLCAAVDGKALPRQAFRADISLFIMCAVQGSYALTYINQSIIGLFASLCAAAVLFLFAWFVRE